MDDEKRRCATRYSCGMQGFAGNEAQDLLIFDHSELWTRKKRLQSSSGFSRKNNTDPGTALQQKIEA